MWSHRGIRFKALLSAGLFSGALCVSAGVGGAILAVQPAFAQDYTAGLVTAVQAAQGNSTAIQLAISVAVVSAVNGSPGGATAANAQSVAATIIALFSGPAAPFPGLVSDSDLGAAMASAGTTLGGAAAGGIAAAVTATGSAALSGAYTANGGTLSGSVDATGATPGPGGPALPSLLTSLNTGTSTTGLTTGGGSTSITPSPSAPF